MVATLCNILLMMVAQLWYGGQLGMPILVSSPMHSIMSKVSTNANNAIISFLKIYLHLALSLRCQDLYLICMEI